MGISKKEEEQVAEILAGHIAHAGERTKDSTQALIAAINAMYGSLEMFYEQFYKFLDAKSLKEFGALVDQAVQQKKQAKVDFSAIISSDLFKKIIQNFSKVKTSIAGEADHALPLSPYGTAIPYKQPANKDKGDKDR